MKFKNFLIIAICGIGVVYAASQQTRIQVCNLTGNTLFLYSTEVDSYDWDGSSRPDKNLNNIKLDPSKCITRTEEYNKRARGSWFRLTAVDNASNRVSARINQQNAYRYASPPIPSITGDLIQIANNGINADDGLASYRMIYTDNRFTSPSMNRVFIINDVDRANSFGALRDDALITQLALIGSHDSATFKSSSGSICKTQNNNANWTTQLNDGVRFFDIRLWNKDGTLVTTHGGKGNGCGAYDSLNTIFTVSQGWLQSHPKEAIFMVLKFDVAETDENKVKLLKDLMDKFPNLFYTSTLNGTTTLGDVRGKIVPIVRDFSFGSFLSIGLPDDTAGTNDIDLYNRNSSILSPGALNFSVQDRYGAFGVVDGLNGDTKASYVVSLMKNNSYPKQKTLVFNFASSSFIDKPYHRQWRVYDYLEHRMFANNKNDRDVLVGYPYNDYAGVDPIGVLWLDFYNESGWSGISLIDMMNNWNYNRFSKDETIK